MTLGAFCLQGSKLFSASFWKSKGMFSTSGFPAVVGSGPLVPGHSQIGHPTGLLDLVHGLSHGGDRRQGSQRQVVQPLLCCTGRQEKPSLIRHGLLSQGTHLQMGQLSGCFTTLHVYPKSQFGIGGQESVALSVPSSCAITKHAEARTRQQTTRAARTGCMSNGERTQSAREGHPSGTRRRVKNRPEDEKRAPPFLL